LGDRETNKFEQLMKVSKDTIQRYEFGKSDKLSQEQYKFLQNIFRQFSDSVTTRIVPILQTRFQLDLEEIRITTYSAFIHTLPDPSTMVVFKIDPETRALLTLDFSLSFALLDKLMGGKGETLTTVRDFTEIEMVLLQKTMVRILDSYAEAWREVRDFKPQLVEIRLNPQAVVIVGPSENMLIAPFKARIANTQGKKFELCIPLKHLRNIVPRSSFEEYMLTKSSQGVANQAVPPVFAKNLETARVPVSCELGRAEILFQDLLQLEVGDYLLLDEQINQPLRIKVNERTKFLGRPGKTKDNKIGIQIIKVLTEGDEEFEE